MYQSQIQIMSIFSKHCYILFICVAIITSIVACKKYPEDEHTTLRTPLNRLAGKWQMVNFTYDSKDLTGMYVKNGLGCVYEFFKDKDKKENSSLLVACPYCYEQKYLTQPIDNNLLPLYCNFEFEQKEKTLRIYGPLTADSLVRDTGAFLLLPKADWVIRKLTTKELKLDVTLNDKVSSLYFTKK